ncbi:sensor histidine kinase [Marinibactrum halimedae]|uniref:histidine kinase n=1 Tax=Marinibactrum halimedae TaxID=1444977 RepID=A0AA37T064_9GAMM|nr:ATP-binding protein [Marinibactrum halimedae]MCD9459703.1 ATP-binding protein [Marinibactrum halimedae]GLS24539.1 hypothetical protein GCM10007877_02510 [Marinibactrum halimedae]
MYKRKLAFFAGLLVFVIVITSVLVVMITQITRSSLTQNAIAQSLLNEHLIVSSTSYRLFKQLTDELIFGKDANQAEVRNKRAIIDQSIEKIIQLEEKQRNALGEEATLGSIEDTSELSALLDEIIQEFRSIIDDAEDEAQEKNRMQQQRTQQLLEVTIDNRFREAINAAVTRQSRVVASMEARIQTLHQSIFWYSILLALLAIPMVVFGCYWLLGVLYQPLNSIRLGAEAISQENYQYRISRGFDAEFDTIAASFNAMAEELLQQRNRVESATRELEFQVAQRTAELTDANQLLQDNDKDRREFFGDISHELRTPLSIIRGEVQVTLRQKTVSEEDYKATLQTVLDQSLSLSRLVDDLLLIARAESGKMRLVPRQVNVEEFVVETVKKIDGFIERRKVKLEVDIEPNMPLVEFDPERIAQVMIIILDNALNHTVYGARIFIHCFFKEDKLIIIIKDEGEGIDEKELPYIFDRYFRGADSRTGKGAGLGLAIAKAIVVGHGGAIDVSSIVGKGSTFTLSLPSIQ